MQKATIKKVAADFLLLVNNQPLFYISFENAVLGSQKLITLV